MARKNKGMYDIMIARCANPKRQELLYPAAQELYFNNYGDL